jgi:acylphosphatase
MIAACRRGPTAARVDAVQEDACSPDLLSVREGGERFSVLSTI